MAIIQINNLLKVYGDFRAVDNLNLTVSEGEFLVLLGPSGCGKTTSLKMIAGFTEPTSGSIRIGGRDVTYLPPHRRNLGVVFQNYALFPHLSVFENVAFPLRRRKEGEDQIRKKVVEALELVQLGHLSARLPKELSGGQQQRVAIARALCFRPDVLLLDEPLSNLDAKLRLEVRHQIRRLQQSLGITTVMVTHDQEEAMSVADRLVVMKSGVVQQIGSSQEIYQSPSNEFVASFIGSVNFLKGSVRGKEFLTEEGVCVPGDHLPANTRLVVVRPEAISLSCAQAPAGEAIAANVLDSVYLGAHSEITVALGGHLRLTARKQNSGRLETATERFQPGQQVYCHIPAEAVRALAN